MTCISKSGLHLVYDKETLIKVVAFLELGFGWDKHRSKKILECLESLNKNTPKAALFAENGEIKIAILLFEQTTSENSSSKIINLSAWYAKQSHRGIEAVRFAKKLTEKLSDFTITNYTPSLAVKKILITLGYEYMNVDVVSYGVVKMFPFIQLRHFGKKFNFFKSGAKPVKLTFEHDRDISSATYAVATVRKFGLKLRILNIFLTKDERFISFNWLVKQCLLNFVVQVNIYEETSSALKESTWLVKSIDNDAYIHPQNSELSISE